MFPCIVADIGGTNARFALATAKSGQKYRFKHIKILAGAEFPTFEAALASYIHSLDGIEVKAACIAIAGPIEGDRVSMTNLAWDFSMREMKEKFAFNTFDVINDFAAVAIATSRLDVNDVTQITSGQANPHANKAILGAGTGLGVAGLAYDARANSWLPISSEGGHVNIAPTTVFEADLIKVAIKRFGHVSAETFLSGPGLVNLYSCICELRGESPQQLKPKDVTALALARDDEACLLSLQLFCAFFGSFAGNLALSYGGKGGVYIAGGIVPRFVDFLCASDFSRRFHEKGVMSHYLDEVPVSLIHYDQTAFLGAATWLEQLA